VLQKWRSFSFLLFETAEVVHALSRNFAFSFENRLKTTIFGRIFTQVFLHKCEIWCWIWISHQILMIDSFFGVSVHFWKECAEEISKNSEKFQRNPHFKSRKSKSDARFGFHVKFYTSFVFFPQDLQTSPPSKLLSRTNPSELLKTHKPRIFICIFSTWLFSWILYTGSHYQFLRRSPLSWK